MITIENIIVDILKWNSIQVEPSSSWAIENIIFFAKHLVSVFNDQVRTWEIMDGTGSMNKRVTLKTLDDVKEKISESTGGG